MVVVVGVDAANWPFPWGWLYLNVLGNLIASVIWGVPAFWAIWRKLTCAEPGCIRHGKVPVAGTTWKTCATKHADHETHQRLHDRHAVELPHAHDRAHEHRHGLAIGEGSGTATALTGGLSPDQPGADDTMAGDGALPGR